MYAKTLQYTNFNGEKVEETFRFNLSEAEIATLNLKTPGGLDGLLMRAVKTRKQEELVEIFQKFIEMSYGIKSEDGSTFRKSKEIFDDFKYTQAYSDYFMMLATNSEEALAFINGIIPGDKKVTVADIQKSLKELGLEEQPKEA